MPQNIWIPFGYSVEGASHKRRGKVNQDAVNPFRGITTSDGKIQPSIIAVSDGHGGNKYIRSEIGSRIAVAFAARIATENWQISSKMRKDDLADVIRHIKSRFLLSWQKAVDEHFKKNNFNDEDKLFLKENCSSKDYDALLNNPRLAYGCTFLCAIGYDDLVLILQLGDGDILGLYPNDLVRELIKPDPRNIGNETLSLCSFREMNDVEDKPIIIAHEILIGDEIPELITLTTDGIKNSYNDQTSDIKAFYNIPVVIKNELKKNDFNINEIKNPIEKWLEKVTTNGSGDDVTIGVLFRNVL